jgi:hypothetical protein
MRCENMPSSTLSEDEGGGVFQTGGGGTPWRP